SFYRSLGAEVTLIELLPRIMPAEDAEIAAYARKRFEKRGIRVLTEAKVSAVKRIASGISASIEHVSGSVEEIAAERLMSAVGVQCNVEGLGLEPLGVKVDRGTI